MSGEPVEPLGPPPQGDGRPLDPPAAGPKRRPPRTAAEAAHEAAASAPVRTYDDVPEHMSWVGGGGVSVPEEFEFQEEQEARGWGRPR